MEALKTLLVTVLELFSLFFSWRGGGGFSGALFTLTFFIVLCTVKMKHWKQACPLLYTSIRRLCLLRTRPIIAFWKENGID